jgi:hypothetical protein
MGMGFAGRGNEKDRTNNRNDRTWEWERNGRTGMVAEHGMTDYYCSLNK